MYLDATIICNPLLVIIVTRTCDAWDVCKYENDDHVGSIKWLMDALMVM